MIPNRKECKQELEYAYAMQRKGYHVATSPDDPESENICSAGPLKVMMVNNTGYVMKR